MENHLHAKLYNAPIQPAPVSGDSSFSSPNLVSHEHVDMQRYLLSTSNSTLKPFPIFRRTLVIVACNVHFPCCQNLVKQQRSILTQPTQALQCQNEERIA